MSTPEKPEQIEQFDPRDPKYKKVEDIPEEARDYFKDVDGGGFVLKQATRESHRYDHSDYDIIKESQLMHARRYLDKLEVEVKNLPFLQRLHSAKSSELKELRASMETYLFNKIPETERDRFFLDLMHEEALQAADAKEKYPELFIRRINGDTMIYGNFDGHALEIQINHGFGKIDGVAITDEEVSKLVSCLFGPLLKKALIFEELNNQDPRGGTLAESGNATLSYIVDQIGKEMIASKERRKLDEEVAARKTLIEKLTA